MGSVITGVLAAFFWFRASRRLRESESWEMVTRPEDVMDVYWQLRVVHDNGLEAAKLNRKAALWAAA
jgi:hypothetical protein